ncbi:hypothetical protein [Dialister sp.]|uniref:hypothetical protein n=1 Tax=Dialister sp. TaxID=1955814 RepID=UPI0025DE53FE|nr:hypothetical protein [Dialister sp.]
MRNVKKIIDDSIGSISPRYDMSAEEIKAIYRLAGGDYLSIASYFFHYGYEMGHRATVTGAYDKAMRQGAKRQHEEGLWA